MQHHAKGEIPGLMEMVVARAEVDFLKGITLGGIFVDVSLWVEKIGTSSFSMVYEIHNGDELYARVKTVQVGVDKSVSKSRPLNDDERKFLEKYLIQE
jgi:acyl-CoA thioester hydrolase